MQIPRPKLNYANVIATIALFVALGGAAVAAGLPKKSVGAPQLKPGAVTTKALRKKAVTAGKIAPKAVTAGKLGANAVLPGNLGNGLISTEKLADGAVIAGKIRNGSVTTNKLDNGAATTAKLGDGAVTSAKLGKGAVTTAGLADGSVSVAKLGKGVIGQLQGQLESGETLRGVFAVGGDPKISLDSVSFQFPLANPPAAPKENVLEPGKTTAACPGITGGATPQAAAGQLCVYITSKSAEFEGLEFIPGVTNRLGFGLLAGFTKGNEPLNGVAGQWAVTAP
ncbi:MAG TPA: hypothetical protein VFP21_04980 [Solirubrobacterales bacterium]|nr:hypothetical protein [Solirubrobacterales bacterium]